MSVDEFTSILRRTSSGPTHTAWRHSSTNCQQLEVTDSPAVVLNLAVKKPGVSACNLTPAAINPQWIFIELSFYDLRLHILLTYVENMTVQYFLFINA
jgi:hypothetical protein